MASEAVTGRSTNGRSRDFESLCLGSNPSRPTRLSTPGQDDEIVLGFFGGATCRRSQAIRETQAAEGKQYADAEAELEV
jgi:hypothetical protein